MLCLYKRSLGNNLPVLIISRQRKTIKHAWKEMHGDFHAYTTNFRGSDQCNPSVGSGCYSENSSKARSRDSNPFKYLDMHSKSSTLEYSI